MTHIILGIPLMIGFAPKEKNDKIEMSEDNIFCFNAKCKNIKCERNPKNIQWNYMYPRFAFFKDIQWDYTFPCFAFFKECEYWDVPEMYCVPSDEERR